MKTRSVSAPGAGSWTSGLPCGPWAYRGVNSTSMPETTPPRVALEPPRQPEVLALIEELDAYQNVLYPAESNHGIDIDALSRPNVLFAVMRDGAGHAVGCGAV